jgi:hypothetical protein
MVSLALRCGEGGGKDDTRAFFNRDNDAPSLSGAQLPTAFSAVGETLLYPN